MLTHLDIRDLAVVEHLSLPFSEGLTVLTGETGAGKSILLTALGLALGERADAGFIRVGSNRAEINLTFDVSDSPNVKDWLEEQELFEGDECVIRRIVTDDGRSKAFINGRPVTLQSLQAFSQGLVEIHGQHAHVLLLKSSEQRRLLDEASGHSELVQSVGGLYRTWRALRERLDRLTHSASDQAARVDLLTYQVEELEQFDIQSLDYEALVEEHTRQAHVGRILEVGQVHLEALYEHDSQSVSAQLMQAIQAMQGLSKLAPEFLETVALLEEAQVGVKEASFLLRRQLERLDVDPVRLDALDKRLGDLHQLARKHHIRPEELPNKLDGLKAELGALSKGSESIEDLQLAHDRALSDYRLLAGKLTEERKTTAARMEKKISGIIQELGMPQGVVKVHVETDEYRNPLPDGLDSVEFLVSANPGLPPRSLAKVASGGELSRISLAIQVAALDSKTVSTLIFDEVDTGIGGGVAEIVGQKLRLLGHDRQVFCVTHLPQVAVQGHNHLRVEKTAQGGVTQSTVRLLESDERIEEIARMLGGVRLTDQTLAHAQEMLSLVPTGGV